MAGATVGVEAAVFDPSFNINTQGGHYFRQTSTLINSLGTGIPTLNTTFWNSNGGLNQVYFEKLFVTGGRAQVGVGQNLTSYSPTGDFVTINPAWQSTLNLILEQPVFRGRGAVATEAPLRIARANQNQSWNAFQTLVNQILRDAEAAYWETSETYREFQLRDLALAQALRTLDREQERMRIGEGAIPDVAQAQEHVEEFRIDRAETETRYIIAQRELRRIMGVPPDDPRPIIPATIAGDAPLVVDWEVGRSAGHGKAGNCGTAGRRRSGRRRISPTRQRFAARPGRTGDLLRQRSRQPTRRRLELLGGLGLQRLDGRRRLPAAVRASRRSIAGATCGIGAKHGAGSASATRARSHLSIGRALDDLQATEKLLGLHRRRREAAAVQLEARRELYFEGRTSLRDQVDAEERYTDAMISEAAARVDYQRAITRWNFARGAINDASLDVSE